MRTRQELGKLWDVWETRGKAMRDLAEAALDYRDAKEALANARKIERGTNMEVGCEAPTFGPIIKMDAARSRIRRAGEQVRAQRGQ